ncbi:MAG: glycosyltransferase family 2 protein [Hyphomonas sp.]|uniref:glycosyltransferase family 2 protein n=1 Tax=Hyphomonas sp. TaxID=87 RepID=UPI0035274873
MTVSPPGSGYDETKVAIVIPLYNDAENIGRAIECAVRQEVPAGTTFEVIVVDDCSTDEGPSIAEEYARRYEQVVFHRQPRNLGPSGARNAALRSTNAGWFTPFDSDDVMEPARIARLLERGRRQGLDIVADNLIITHNDAPTTAVRRLWPGKPAGDIELTPELFLERSSHVELERSELGFLKPLIRRSSLIGDDPAPYLEELRFGEDFELYARMLLNGAKAMLTDPEGYYFVCREGSASRSQGREDHMRLARISRELLRRPGISAVSRKALQEHTAYCEREWAVWASIEAVRSKSIPRFLEAYTISFPASLHVTGRMFDAVVARAASGFRKQPN